MFVSSFHSSCFVVFAYFVRDVGECHIVTIYVYNVSCLFIAKLSGARATNTVSCSKVKVPSFSGMRSANSRHRPTTTSLDLGRLMTYNFYT